MIRNLQIAGQGRLKLLGPNLWMAAPYGCLWLLMAGPLWLGPTGSRFEAYRLFLPSQPR